LRVVSGLHDIKKFAPASAGEMVGAVGVGMEV